MSFVSFGFFLFFPCVTVTYFLLPHQYRWIWLLTASYFFYMCFNPWYAVFLAASTLTTYLTGLQIGKAVRTETSGKQILTKKTWVVLCLVVNFGILLVFKYLNLFSRWYAQAAALFGFSFSAMHFDLLLPVGISFFTFQAVTYIIDVYRGDTKPQRHLGKYALFVSFFPQITSGPISKSKDLLYQFDEIHIFDEARAKRGLLLMLWGYFQKMVVADRLGILVDTVYSHPEKYYGLASLLAVVFYSFQIYCDFAGYSDIAIGAAEVLGFRLPVNFNRPYFARSVQEFWRRWHISLSSWFRDYLYIPLGGNRCSVFRHCLNIVIVFTVCGFWHGAAVGFLVWGLLHGLYQVAGLLTKKIRSAVRATLKIRTDSFWYRAWQAAVTFLLVTFAWIFFRAATLADAATVIGSLFRFDPAAFWNGSAFQLGLDQPEMAAAVIGLLIVLAVDWLSRKKKLIQSVLSFRTSARWAFYITAVMILIIFGIYGSQYDAQQFIYYQF